MFDQWRWVILLQERGVSTERCLLSTWVWVFEGSLSLILLFLFGPPLFLSEAEGNSAIQHPIRTRPYDKQPGPMPFISIGPELLTFMSFPHKWESTL